MKKEAEFNLSKTRHRNSYEDEPDLDWLYDERDVKKFIRKLKEEITEIGFTDVVYKKDIFLIIKKLAGDEPNLK